MAYGNEKFTKHFKPEFNCWIQWQALRLRKDYKIDAEHMFSRLEEKAIELENEVSASMLNYIKRQDNFDVFNNSARRRPGEISKDVFDAYQLLPILKLRLSAYGWDTPAVDPNNWSNPVSMGMELDIVFAGCEIIKEWRSKWGRLINFPIPPSVKYPCPFFLNHFWAHVPAKLIFEFELEVNGVARSPMPSKNFIEVLMEKPDFSFDVPEQYSDEHKKYAAFFEKKPNRREYTEPVRMIWSNNLDFPNNEIALYKAEIEDHMLDVIRHRHLRFPIVSKVTATSASAFESFEAKEIQDKLRAEDASSEYISVASHLYPIDHLAETEEYDEKRRKNKVNRAYGEGDQNFKNKRATHKGGTKVSGRSRDRKRRVEYFDKFVAKHSLATSVEDRLLVKLMNMFVHRTIDVEVQEFWKNLTDDQRANALNSYDERGGELHSALLALHRTK